MSSATLTMTMGLLVAAAPKPGEAINLDFFTGPVVGSSRVVGMGGAYVGLAEGAEGQANNPAAMSTRYPWSNAARFDYDWALSSMQDLGGNDLELDLSGRTTRGFELTDGAFHLKWSDWAFGLRLEHQLYRYALENPRSDQLNPVRFRQQVVALGLARRFFRGGLHLGFNTNLARAGIHDCDLGVKDCDWYEEVDLVTIRGAGSQFGLLLTPLGKPFRLGLSYRSKIIAFRLGGEKTRLLRGELPDALIIPGQISLGGSWFFGKRAYNLAAGQSLKGAADGAKTERRYLLISAEVQVTRATPEGHGTLAFLANEEQPAGQRPSLSPRAGVESEVLNNRLVIRAGSYFEPSRFFKSPHGPGRWHATAGADLRIRLKWDLKLSCHADFARAYQNVGLGLGLWH